MLLDDVFSGMDAHTAETVFNRLLGEGRGLLRNRQTTVVLITYNCRYTTPCLSVTADTYSLMQTR